VCDLLCDQLAQPRLRVTAHADAIVSSDLKIVRTTTSLALTSHIERLHVDADAALALT